MELAFRARILAACPGLPVNFGVNPEGTPYPSAVVNVVGRTGAHTMDGADRTRRARVQVDIYATRYADLVSKRDEVIAALDAFQSDEIAAVFFDSASQSASEGKHRAMLLFLVVY